MKRKTIPLLYVFSFLGLATTIWWVLSAGKGLEHLPEMRTSGGIVSTGNLSSAAAMPYQHPLAIFILQLIVIITTSQACAWLFKKVRQPAVMGEIVAGILLGPSLLGALLPEVSTFIFPAASLGNIQMLSQVGLVLFMFVIGMELDINLLKKRAGAAIFISYFSIIIPFGLGIVLSYFLYQQYAPSNIPFYAFSLFIGIAMSITAFPVLARIIRERGISGTNLGITAITAAAVGDVTAWCMLAFIIAVVRSESMGAPAYTFIAAIAYIAIMFLIVKPLLSKLSLRNGESLLMKRSVMAVIFVVLLLSSYCCEVIGIHALFGAFLAGIIMPDQWNFRKRFIDKIEDVALVLLLPLFFVSTGLRTQVGLLNTASLWYCCGWIILVAIAGKSGGSALAARIIGENKKDSLSIGALMNTRGLVELVVLNIGYDLHILPPQIFTMMVIMALATTLMTSPAINFINRRF